MHFLYTALKAHNIKTIRESMLNKKHIYIIIGALLMSSVQNNYAIEIESNVKNISLFTISSVAALSLAGIIGWQCSGNKYAYLAQKATFDREEQKAERERIAQEKFDAKIKTEQFVLQNVDNLLASFMPLINEFSNQANTKLEKDQKFQAKLVHAILGNNAQTDRLGTLNLQIWHHEQSLIKVDNPELADTKLKKLRILRWLKEQVNSSPLARLKQNELERQKLALELERNKVTISKEQAEQERIQTKTIKKEAELRQKAAQELANTAQGIQSKLNHIRTDLEDQMTTLRRSVNRQLNDLNAWQANNAKDRSETQRLLKASQHEYKRLELLLATVEATCNSLQQFIGNFAQQLTRIEQGQNKLLTSLIKQINSIVAELGNKQSTHHKQLLEMMQSLLYAAQDNNTSIEPSAPPLLLDPSNEASDAQPAYNPELFDAKK